MKRILICCFSIIFGNFLISNCFASNYRSFIDIESHWAKEEICFMLENEIVKGYEDGNFKPNKEISLGEFLKILLELSQYSLEKVENIWPDMYLETAVKKQWINESQKEEWNKGITRYEVANILGKYIGLEDEKVSTKGLKDLNEKEKQNVLKLIKLEVIKGYEDNTFRGEKIVTRAEACKMIKKAYEVKQEILSNKKYEITSKNSNIGKDEINSLIKNRYEIKENRIYIYDLGRYANFNGQTLNQEYIQDEMIVNILESLVDDESYTEIKYIPDKYTINSLNVFYGKKEANILQGMNTFQIRFYENAYYDVAKSKNESTFMKNASVKIKLGKMWEQITESKTDIATSEKNLAKLESVIRILVGNKYKNEVMEYVLEKRIEAGKIEDSEKIKISEVKKFGKYIINIWCKNGQELEIFLGKN